MMCACLVQTGVSAAKVVAEDDLRAQDGAVVANRPLSLDGSAPAPHVIAARPMVTANRPVAIARPIDLPIDVDLLSGRQGPPRSHTAPPEYGPLASPVSDVKLVSAQDQDAPPQPGQGGARQEDQVVRSIDVNTSQAEVINLARNTSATIELHLRVDRAEVVDPTIADISIVSPTQISVTGRAFGTTQLILWSGDRQSVFDIVVELDLNMLRSLIKMISPAADVHLYSVNGRILLTGTVPNEEVALQIDQLATMFSGVEAGVANQLTVAGVQQAMLRVVVAEVNREATRRLGVNWAIGASDLSRDFFFANNLNQLNPTTFGSTGLPNVLQGQQLFSVAPTANGTTTNVTFGFPRAEFQMFVDALRENSLARVLAEPNLVAISGQTATFLAGGEVPLSVVSSTGGTSTVSIIYKEFGVRLGFTPTVLGGQLMRLHILSEVSEPVPVSQVIGGLPVFSFNTRRVETTIECGNGQTFAIAGLLSQEVNAIASKIPGLGDIPILGTMFSSTEYQKNNTELVVLVTPQLVEPLDPQQVPSPPGSRMTDPNDYELFTLQQLEGPPKLRPEYDFVPREQAPVTTPPSASANWPTANLALRGPWGLADDEDKN